MTKKGIISSLCQRRISLWLIAIACFASASSAETTVCSGDSVVIVLDGYKQGSTQWQQSSDLNTWSDVSGNKYNDSLVFIATNTLYYRAIVTDGTCSPYYSDTVMIVVTKTPPPLANISTDVAPISFTANWTASVDTTTYYLDVATDANFTSFVLGYNNLNVGNDTTYSVYPLSCNTPYYYRVRAYNFCGGVSDNSNVVAVSTSDCPGYCTYKSTCNGNITDIRDNKTYKTVQIGTQCWMAQNLNVGDSIPGAIPQTPGTDNQDTSIEKYCWGDNAANCTTYGGLYSWDEMMAYGLSDAVDPGPRGICPVGWHIPTDNEWNCLEETLGSALTAGGKLKDTGPLWKNPNKDATNSSGFSALPGGSRVASGMFSYGGGTFGYWWTATEDSGPYTWSRYVQNSVAMVSHYHAYKASLVGFSVRCVKD